MRALAAALVLAPLVFLDLDLDTPPGTPLEWSRDFNRPVPTGRGAGVPTTDRTPRGAGAGSTAAEEPGKAAPAPVATIDATSSNLYDHFRVLTHDIMSHVSTKLPKSTGRVSQDEEATGGGSQIVWNYPPELPTELFWMAGAAYLRHLLHPDVSPWPETAAYLLELGEPAFHGQDVLTGLQQAVGEKFSSYVTDRVKALPKDPPTPPGAKDPRDALLRKLVAVELAGGYPYALDPTYARRTLSLGDDALGAVAACARDAHPFLARNAVAVLAQISGPQAADELRKIFKESRDPVVRVRILLALARRGDNAILPELVREAESADAVMRALGLHALGVLRDPAGAQTAVDLVKGAPQDPDLLWSAVPALGRMRAGREPLLEIEAALSKKIRGNDVVRTRTKVKTPQDQHARTKVLHQMCVITLTMIGEKRFADEILRRMQQVGFDSFYPTVHYLLIEALAATDDGATWLKKMLDKRAEEPGLQLEALRALAREKRLDGPYLRDRALDVKAVFAVRARALRLLATVDAPLARDVCAKLVGEFAGGTGDVHPGHAFLVAAAAQIAGPTGALDRQDLLKATQRAFDEKVFARREGENTVDITKATVIAVPPLLETLAIELGRTGWADAVPLLAAVLTKLRFPQSRSEAALALGAIPGKEADQALVEALDDRDGWVRWCAYGALAKRSGQDHFCDWVFGDVEHRRKSTEAYRAWLKSR